MVRGVAAVLAGLALTPAVAGAQTPDAGFLAGSIDDRLEAETRGADQVANTHYARAFEPVFRDWIASGHQDDRVLVDPFRLAWGTTRGQEREIEYRNRYGATIRGRLWAPRVPWRDPVTGTASSGPFPAVVFVNGFGNPEEGYRGLAQGLAESGYVVLSFDPQGQGDSDVEPNPRETFCDPDGAWRQPQELGLREHGECAGMYPEGSPVPRTPVGDALDGTPLQPAGDLVDLAAFVVELYLDGDFPDSSEAFDAIRPNFVFGALDAAGWLLSDANPLRHLVDGERIGLVGHSAGADGAIHAAHGDPLGRFDVAVAFDQGVDILPRLQPRIPTMVQYAEQQNAFGPRIRPPDPDRFPGARTGAAFRAAGVPNHQIALRGSTHQEWLYLPYQLINPLLAPFFNASRYGERVGLYYAQAWLDRWLKPGAAQATDARRRLTARTFDGSADGSSIGTGRVDPLTGANVPYRIAGQRVPDRLSATLRSAYAFDGLSCPDMRAGCGPDSPVDPVTQTLSRLPVALGGG